MTKKEAQVRIEEIALEIAELKIMLRKQKKEKQLIEHEIEKTQKAISKLEQERSECNIIPLTN